MSLMSTGSDTNFNSLGSNPLPLTNNHLFINDSIFTPSQNSQDIAQLAASLPFYAKIAESPNASNSFRNWYRYIRSQVEGIG